MQKSSVNLIWRGESVLKQLGEESYNRLNAIGEDTVSEIKEVISVPGTGKFYKKGKTVFYQSSAPGFPPTVKIGELKGSISHIVVIEGSTTYLYIGTTKDYGYWLEVGTVNMEARPWLGVTLKRLFPDMKVSLLKEWQIV